MVLSSNTTLTSASASFTSADTGKTIMINGGAGNAGGPLVTTITFSNSTTVTLGTGASVSGSAFVAVYGTDDTAAINSALSAGVTYATTLSATPGSGNYFFECIFSPKIYMLTSGPTQATSPQTNAQVRRPVAERQRHHPQAGRRADRCRGQRLLPVLGVADPERGGHGADVHDHGADFGVRDLRGAVRGRRP